MRAAGFLARRMAAASGRRAMSSAHGHSYPHGMHFHVSPVHKNLALAYGTMLWLWVFWRAKNDGLALLGLEHPWEHGNGHHDEAHAEAAPKSSYLLVDGKIKYERSEIGALPTPVELEEEEEEETEESSVDDVVDDLHDEDDE